MNDKVSTSNRILLLNANPSFVMKSWYFHDRDILFTGAHTVNVFCYAGGIM